MGKNVRRLWIIIEINVQETYFNEFIIIITNWLDFIGFNRWCWSDFYYSKIEIGNTKTETVNLIVFRGRNMTDTKTSSRAMTQR